MNIKDYCLTFPYSVEDYPFGPETLVMKVNNKIFALLGKDDSISLKCNPFAAIEYREMFNGVKPGYHLNKKYWNTVSLNDDVNEEMIKVMIKESYIEVVKKFPKRDREKYLSKL
ncbi:MmcQ/YjbR family DNA-binding protein [Clostridium sp. 'White wine YQ']|uniref:MmcQ/YjbR family DNA-binding protein n=1 Tax=Clostridium sp. 'White wine YQ' TaxID=3027474 RepID=UPI002365993A|nr:MmcQ/YjbR family DNA-binding protein [Clostridium sp. 'White wine YQ']MDD7795701.1 MmcQ/YjbR family DNA-binding protein [Clostridium sp. 'White wine YQ']